MYEENAFTNTVTVSTYSEMRAHPRRSISSKAPDILVKLRTIPGRV